MTNSTDIFDHKNILITGGTGSFGNAFAKRLLKDHEKIKKIVVFSRDEYKQHVMKNKRPFANNSKMRFFIGDVRDKERLYRAFEGIDLVIHAAALKQIVSCEYNPFEAIKTNVYGAQNIIEAAIDRGVEKVVALSTDKACQPINMYGASKLSSDKLFIAGNAYVGKKNTSFAVVRYGNVAGSRGSVIPLFKKFIKRKQEFLPITDKHMTRFWLKLDEAVDLVLEALETMQGGELYVRKIPSVKVTDIAKAIAPKLPLKEVGIRPGEKLHEMMISTDDARNTLEFKNYYIVQPQFNWWTNNHSQGTPVAKDFEYHSGNNEQWLSVQQIRKLISEI